MCVSYVPSDLICSISHGMNFNTFNITILIIGFYFINRRLLHVSYQCHSVELMDLEFIQIPMLFEHSHRIINFM